MPRDSFGFSVLEALITHRTPKSNLVLNRIVKHRSFNFDRWIVRCDSNLIRNDCGQVGLLIPALFFESILESTPTAQKLIAGPRMMAMMLIKNSNNEPSANRKSGYASAIPDVAIGGTSAVAIASLRIYRTVLPKSSGACHL